MRKKEAMEYNRFKTGFLTVFNGYYETFRDTGGHQNRRRILFHRCNQAGSTDIAHAPV